MKTISQINFIFENITLKNRRLNLNGFTLPIAIIPRRIDAGQKRERRIPQCLDLDGVTFTWRARREVGVHPGKMGWAENETRFRIHPNTVGCSGHVSMTDGKENLADGPTAILRIKESITPLKL